MKTKNLLFLLPLFLIFSNACGHEHPGPAEDSGQAWIGVVAQDLDDEMRDYLKVKQNYGVLVNDVVPDSPAEKAGLREEDVILKFNGKEVRDTEHLTRLVKEKNPGDKVNLQILRNEKEKEIALSIGELPRKFFSRNKDYHHSRRPKSPHSEKFFGSFHNRPRLGIEMGKLNKDLAEYFGVAEDGGVLILSVSEDSPAEKAGLKAGDVIIKIAGNRVRKPDDVRDIIADKNPDETITVEVKRKGETKQIEVKLDKSFHSSSFQFDEDNWDEFKDHMHEWQEGMDEWKNEWRDNIDHHIELDIPIEDIGDELQRTFENLGEELEIEMEHLQDELQNLHIDIEVNGKGQIL